MLIALAVVLLVLGGTALWGMWQPALRVAHVTVQGSTDTALQSLVERDLEGTYVHILPRNSIFFVPVAHIRADILSAYADIGAVSVSRPSLDAITVSVMPRTNAYLWCGASMPGSSVDTATTTVSVNPGTDTPCYDTDPEGFIFKQVSTDSASSTPFIADKPLQAVRIYAPLTGEVPIRAHLIDAPRIPVALQFARALSGIGASPVSLVVRGDEGDFYLASGTRITFVLGDESAAAERAAAALPTLNVGDGSVEYIDLRFDGKVYVKKATSK